MPTGRVKEFLNAQGVRYVSIHHSPAYTAQEVAAYAHVPGKELAKTVMVKLDRRMAMAVLPASYTIDFGAQAAAAGASKSELAKEGESKDLFPECELGAMPSCGNLHGMEVYAAKRLAEDAEIAFNAGTHRQLIRLPYEDSSLLVQPRLVSFAL